MAKNKSTIMMPTPGKVMKTENGTQYFVCGNSRIKIS